MSMRCASYFTNKTAGNPWCESASRLRYCINQLRSIFADIFNTSFQLLSHLFQSIIVHVHGDITKQLQTHGFVIIHDESSGKTNFNAQPEAVSN